MKFSSLITAVAVCALILGLILKRDDLLTYFNGDEDAVLAKINEDIAKAEATKAEAEAALAAAKAEVESAKANLPKDAVAENARDKAVSVLASKSLEQDVRSGILLRGQTSAFKFVEVKAETSGQVTSTPLRKGTLVSEGQLLCELDPGTKASDLAEARARLAEAQKNNAASAELVKKGFASETQAIGRRATLEAAEAAGAVVISAECPTCHSGLDMHLNRALKRLSKNTNVKVIYFTQLLGMAMGLTPRKVGLNANISDSMKFVKEKGIA